MWTSHGLNLHTEIGCITLHGSGATAFLHTAQCYTDRWVELCCNWGKLWVLEADLATRHRVTQLGLIVDEGHNAQIGLNEQGSLEDQDTVSPTGDGVLLMGFLHCLHQLGPEVVQLDRAKQKNMKPEQPSKNCNQLCFLALYTIYIYVKKDV